MGKFGARELNYSSDIDLIVLCDDHVVPDQPAGQHGANLCPSRARSCPHYGGTDAGRLCLPYGSPSAPRSRRHTARRVRFGSRSLLRQPWAELGARGHDQSPAGGRRSPGRPRIPALPRPFWRRSLDFAAIQDIHSIKRQINAHRGYKAVAVNNHNVKVGRGGIREIEFFAQTQQLIFGGRDPTSHLRHGAKPAGAGRCRPDRPRGSVRADHGLPVPPQGRAPRPDEGGPPDPLPAGRRRRHRRTRRLPGL